MILKHSFKLISITVVMLALLVVLLPGVARPNAISYAQTEQIATLDPIGGVVQHQTAAHDPHDPQAWTILTAPILLGPGDRVRTNRDGQAILTFFEGVQSEIGPNTLVVISTMALGESGATSDPDFNISLDVLIGTTLTTIDLTLDAEDRFEIHTPGATAVVRGTTWWTVVHADGSAEFESVEGAFGVLPDSMVGTDDMVLGDPRSVTADMLWSAWIEYAPGRTVYFDADGSPLAPPDAIRLPGRNDTGLRASPTCGDDVCQPFEINTCPMDCVAELDLSACGNGICEIDANEDMLVCPGDCSPFAGTDCGNDRCDADESGVTCPADCDLGQYFAPSYPALCGNEICDPTESSLNCPTDCVSTGEIPTPDRCTLTGNGANLRTGPGTDYTLIEPLLPDMTLIVNGVSVDGEWYVAQTEAGRVVWVTQSLVIPAGPCEDLPVREAP